MTLTLERFEDSRRSTWTLTGDQIVRRAEPGAVHHRDEFLGMTLREAQAWAGALGWGFRDRSASGFVTDDLRTDRINVWTDERGVVIRTEMS